MELPERFEAALIEFTARLEEKFDERFDRLDERLDVVDHHFDLIDRKFDALDQQFETMDRRFDAIDARFEVVDRRFEEMEERFDKKLDVRFYDFEKSLLTKMDEKIDDLAGMVARGFTEMGNEIRALGARVEVLEEIRL